MDNSQNSNIFSDSEDLSCDNVKADIMDTDSYESLVTNTKTLLSKTLQKEISKASFSTYFASVLENCSTCIFQSLELIIGLIDNTDIQLSKLQSYMNDAVCLLRMLSSFIKNVIESISMPCCTMKTFPTTTGRIIMAVFTHCKDSENIYGHNLKSVEKQLKDLFRTCHELQLTYLMIIEKHFIFDLSEKEEFDILVEALDINLKIGEIVQTLDVKTMAEQWKAYTMICEKHSNGLKDTHIYYNCSKILCAMTESNINIAVEVDQDEKITLKSLKVASFAIKILLKLCNIFKLTKEKNYKQVIELLLYIYLNNNAYLELNAEKSPKFVNLMNVNVFNPADALLRELLLDEHFGNCVLKCDQDILKKDDKLLGYILLLVSIIKSILQMNDDSKITKQKLIESIFRFLPSGHIWFNMRLKFKAETKADSESTYGLYEHLLSHTLALSATLNAREIISLEQKMYEAILSTNCYSALFSSNLWVLLARLSNRQFALSQLVSLCKTYQRLENNKLFNKSPQQVHLSYTMSRLFEILHSEDKSRVYKQFSIKDDKNAELWVALQIQNLNKECQYDAEEIVTEKLKEKFHKLFTTGIKSHEDIEYLTKTMKLASTCQLKECGESVEDIVVKAWTKLCPKNNDLILSIGDLDKGAVWYLEYIDALVSVTESMKYLFKKSANLVKVLHVISTMIQKGNSELKLTLINLLCQCQLALCLVHDDNKYLAESLLMQSVKHLLQENDNAVRNRFFNALRKYSPNKNIDKIISHVINEDNSLRETWHNFINHGKLKNVNTSWKEQLKTTMEFKYCHKCVESRNVIELSDGSVKIEKISNNFDLADIDSLFDIESDSEPACKKVKLNTNEAVEIIARLENDTALLCNVKENVFTFNDKVKIRNICEKLLNIIE